MNNTKKIMLVAVVFIIVGGLGGFVAFSSSGNPVDVSETKTVEQQFSDITINSDNVGVELRTTDKPNATIEMVGKTHKSVSYNFDANVEDEVLVISSYMSVPLSWVNVYPNNLKIVVTLPEHQYRSLTADGNNSMLYISGLQAEKIDCTTQNGSTTLETITADTMNISADAYVGLSDIQCDAINVKSSASLELAQIEASEITARAGAKITLETSHLERTIDLESTGGSIQVKTKQAPNDVRFDVSSHGSINLFGGKYAGNINSETGEHLVRLVSVGSITVEEVSR